MGILTYIRDSFFPWTKQKGNFNDLDIFCKEAQVDLSFKTYAIHIAISMIANALSLCEFETYEKKKLIKGNNWWTFNFEPNLNQNKYKFWHDVVYQMVYNEHGALIIQSTEGYYIVADKYDLEERAFYKNKYSNIELKNTSLFRVRYEDEVLHLTLDNTEIKDVVDSVYKSYGKLISGSVDNYNRGNAMKFIMKVGAMFDQFSQVTNEETGETEADRILDDVLENRMEGLLSADSSVTPLEDGLELIPIETSANTKSGAVTTRDITATFDDIKNIVADAFHIPRGLMMGDIADVEAMTKNFITFAVMPLAEQIESEINRKIYGKDNVAFGTKLKVDTSTITIKDPISFAASAEALFRIGAYSINDILRKLGEETIDEDWANERYVTKNYEGVTNNEKKT